MVAPTLLVIEADSSLQTLIATILAQGGYIVHTAMPHDYLYMAQQTHPALVLLSCDRYGLTIPGWDMAYTLRRELPQALLIMLSTDPDAVGEVGATVRGCQFVAALRKPFLAEDLLATVADQLYPLPPALHHERARS